MISSYKRNFCFMVRRDIYRDDLPYISRPLPAIQEISELEFNSIFLEQSIFSPNLSHEFQDSFNSYGSEYVFEDFSHQLFRGEIFIKYDDIPLFPAVSIVKNEKGLPVKDDIGGPLIIPNPSVETLEFNQAVEQLIKWAPRRLPGRKVLFNKTENNFLPTLPQRSNGTVAKTLDVTHMSFKDKLKEVFSLSLPLLPQETAEVIKQLLAPETLAIAAGTLAVWAASHAIGIGEIVDIILLGAGIVMLGWGMIENIFAGGKELLEFARLTKNANSYADLELAAQHFSQAVIRLGVTTIMAILLKKPLKQTNLKVDTPRFKNNAVMNAPRVGGGLSPGRQVPKANLLADVQRVNSTTVNKRFLSSKATQAGWLPPYPNDFSIRQITLGQETKFLRVYTGDRLVGQFLVRPKALKNILNDPEAIRIYLGLKNTPTHIADVYVPSGTKLIVGPIGPQPAFGLLEQSGFQYQLLDQIPASSFQNARAILDPSK